ncbi:MAG: hypothetical protein Kow0090_11080 [Myxococcota bacterium]
MKRAERLVGWLFMAVIINLCLGCAGAQKGFVAAEEFAKSPPAVNYDKLNVPEISLEGASLEHFFIVSNPAQVPLAVQKVAYKYTFLGNVIAETEKTLNLSVPAEGKAEFLIAQRIDFPKEYEPLKELCAKKDGTFDISGTIFTQAGEFPIDVEGDILLPSIPYLKIDNASISKDSADQMSMGFELITANDNPFNVFVSAIKYELYIEGKVVKKDKILIEEMLSSPGKLYNVNAYLIPDNLGKETLKKIYASPQLNYRLVAEFKLKHFTVPVDISGTYNFAK